MKGYARAWAPWFINLAQLALAAWVMSIGGADINLALGTLLGLDAVLYFHHWRSKHAT